MKKRFTMLTVGIVCVASITAGAFASNFVKNIKAELRKDFVIEIDDEVREFENVQGERVYPILYDGTTYLPIRAIGEIMGKKVFWYEDDKKIELKETTVTDADVIIGGADEKTEIKVSDKKEDKYEKKDNDRIDGKEIDTSKFIGEEKAKKIALKKAGLALEDVIFEKVKLDFDDGIWQYEIEFKKGRVEYDAEIAAVGGEILSWEADND